MNLKLIFLEQRNIPYAIQRNILEPNNSCLGKHLLLKEKFEEAGLRVRFRICNYRWQDMNLPEELKKLILRDSVTHLYLEVQRGDQWQVIDATWDPGLASVFPVNEWSESEDMTIAVPVLSTLSPEESDEYMKSVQLVMNEERGPDLEDEFHAAFNVWCEGVRKQNV